VKHFTSVQDVHDINALIQRALQYKQDPWRDADMGKRKRIGLLFLNPSLRTRLSTQVAAQQLGMEAIVFNIDKEGWALEMQEGAIMNGTTVEHVKDAAPLLGAYFDILCIRTFPGLKNREEDYSELVLKQFMLYSGIPVVSLESATLHPLQSLTDLITIHEQKPTSRKPKIVLTWAPHVKALPQCVANSFAQWVNAWGEASFVITHPKGLELKEEFTNGATIIHDQQEALKDADFIYVKNWSAFDPYGHPGPADPTWMLTKKHLQHSPQAKVMHCLPVRRNVEISEEILDSPHSLVTQQGSNRVWAAQAVLASILEKK
jgi:N-succinyl-L-ornithine transcarbamylase